MPKVEFGAGVSPTDENKDPFEDSLEEALCVFKSGGGGGPGGKETDILKENEAQLLFYVDLENEQVVDKGAELKMEGLEGEEEGGDEEAPQSKHPLLLN